jgi:hypothetical protein
VISSLRSRRAAQGRVESSTSVSVNHTHRPDDPPGSAVPIRVEARLALNGSMALIRAGGIWGGAGAMSHCDRMIRDKRRPLSARDQSPPLTAWRGLTIPGVLPTGFQEAAIIHLLLREPLDMQERCVESNDVHGGVVKSAPPPSSALI